ncbi:MAG: cystathionine gamma-synthase, partial [Xanthomonadales bacterium]|nr:cystathionine gamma-synthase [Xanthomonadales bacterium]
MSVPTDTVHPRHQQTIAARYAVDADDNHGAVIPPLYMSSTFSFPRFGEKGAYDYTRSGNPTRDQLAGALAELEGGAGGVITASGMSAVHLTTQLVKPGDLVVAAHDCYGGCHRLFTAAAAKGQFDLEWLPLWETAASVERILALQPRLVWIETPSNPLLRITDIETLSAAAHRVGALVVVDNTFLSPAGQQPFALGADIVLHSTTKYINGHSDVVGGAVLARDPALVEELVWWANCLGLTGSPFDSFQTLRGLRTLNVRYRQHQENAAVIAVQLDAHELVRQVHYPGLKSHPGHELAARQQQGFGAMISFEIDAREDEIPIFLEALQLFTLAESLGGVESLVAHPATMTHAAMSAADQAAAGISSRLLRLS